MMSVSYLVTETATADQKLLIKTLTGMGMKIKQARSNDFLLSSHFIYTHVSFKSSCLYCPHITIFWPDTHTPLCTYGKKKKSQMLYTGIKRVQVLIPIIVHTMYVFNIHPPPPHTQHILPPHALHTSLWICKIIFLTHKDMYLDGSTVHT